jgi:hypothetical protein
VMSCARRCSNCVRNSSLWMKRCKRAVVASQWVRFDHQETLSCYNNNQPLASYRLQRVSIRCNHWQAPLEPAETSVPSCRIC